MSSVRAELVSSFSNTGDSATEKAMRHTEKQKKNLQGEQDQS
jgi:hypothetical protein